MLATLLTVLLNAADVPADDLTKMEGTWIAVSWEFEGKSYPAGGHRLEAKGDRFIWDDGNHKVSTSITHIGPAKEPKEIDLTVVEGAQEQTLLGIYKVDGDTFTVCTSSRGERPTEFSAEPGSGYLLRVPKRNKPKP